MIIIGVMGTAALRCGNKFTCPHGTACHFYDDYCDCEPNWGGDHCDRYVCPCKNGGTCPREDGSCICKTQWDGATCEECAIGYGGSQCQYSAGTLTVYVKGAGKVDPGADGGPFFIFNNKPDPYALVVAHANEGKPAFKQTEVLNGDLVPDWDQDLEFGKGTWAYFTLRVWDKDHNADDPLSRDITVQLGRFMNSSIQTERCFLDSYECSVRFRYDFNRA